MSESKVVRGLMNVLEGVLGGGIVAVCFEYSVGCAATVTLVAALLVVLLEWFIRD